MYRIIIIFFLFKGLGERNFFFNLIRVTFLQTQMFVEEKKCSKVVTPLVLVKWSGTLLNFWSKYSPLPPPPHSRSFPHFLKR